MEQILTQNNNDVDAVVASNDGTAGGVVAALTAQGMEGIPVSGQDGDKAALNRIALGTQTVSVWKDARELGKAAGEIAVALAGGTAIDGVEGAAKFTSPGGNEMNADPADAGCRSPRTTSTSWSTPAGSAKDELCAGVPAGIRRRLQLRPRLTGRPVGAAPNELGRTACRHSPDSCASLEIDLRLLGMIGALLVIWLVFHAVTGGLFLTPRNLFNLSVQTASVAVMATGMVFVIVTRNIDLSVGSLLGLPRHDHGRHPGPHPAGLVGLGHWQHLDRRDHRRPRRRRR